MSAPAHPAASTRRPAPRPLRRGSIDAKAKRLLTDGAVSEPVEAAVFVVRGDTATYRVTLTTDGSWRHCTCRALGECSHLRSVIKLLSSRAVDLAVAA